MRHFIAHQMYRRQKGLFEKLAEFEETQFFSESELRDYQEKKLRNLVRYAYESVPYYKEVFERRGLKPNDIQSIDDLKKLPILDKETFRRNRDKLVSSSISETVTVRRTSGSTGVPLSISVNRQSSLIANALHLRFLKWTGYRLGDGILLFWGEPVVESSLSRLINDLRRAFYNIKFTSTFKVNDQSMLRLIERLERNPPAMVRGYASSIYELAYRAIEIGRKIELNAISTTAEKLYRHQREVIEEAFGKCLFDQYGCGETNSIAHECEKHRGLHVASEHVILETINGDGQNSNRGDVVITNLDNYAMPLIRYKNGDVAKWASEKCPCGRNLPLLAEIEGRVSDFIEGPNGKKVHGEFFSHIFAGLKLGEKYSISEFRIVQEEIDRLRIEFVTTQDLSKSDEAVIREKTSDYLGNVEIEIAKVESIPMTRMGKKMFVLSLLNRNYWQTTEPVS